MAAWSEELRDKPLGVVMLNNPVVLFRTQTRESKVVALEDRCIHRRVPLSMGNVREDRIQCIYHGFEYDCSGACVRIPGQDKIPTGAGVIRYPACERHGCLFVWTGDPGKADEALLPDYSELVDPECIVAKRHVRTPAHYQLVIDNLLDLSHVAFLHASTTGQDEIADHAEVKTEVENDRVRVTRTTLNVPAVNTYLQFGHYKGNIDRWQISEFIAPGFFKTDNGSVNAGNTGSDDNQASQRWGFRVYHGITPESEGFTNYFWGMAHNFDASEEEIAEFHRQCHQVVDEDISIFEAQQKMIDFAPDSKTVGFKYDQGPVAGRKLIERLLRSEASRV
ncbi:MAG: aromatic ring-hydroxylating dioxygenase subunit alpha [Gammaproteobacteria bacterium]|nr:aromatic ring-hydroxylating dioxygenase subunit alpha [Gammaproteobacteria bacterium]